MADPAFEEARALSTALIAVAEHLKDDFAASIAPYGLPVALARALLRIDTPLPMSALAKRLCCDQSYVTGLAGELVARGLITREPGCDRRVKLLTPTAAGAALRDDLARAVSRDSRVLARLDPGERAALADLLSRLSREPAPDGRRSPDDGDPALTSP